MRYFILLLSLILAGCASLPQNPSMQETILELKSGKKVSFEGLIENIKSARVIIIGEGHNKKSHHDIQLKIIRALHEKNLSVAVGMEMLRSRLNRSLAKWSQGNSDEKALKALFAEEWSGTLYPIYAPIFHFIRGKKLPFIGLNIERDITRKVSSEGFQSLSAQEKKGLPPVACDVSDSYRDYIRKVFTGHHHKGGDFTFFCEAQMLWDASMAYHAVRFHEENPGYRLVILCGSAHAQYAAIPARIKERTDIPIRVVIPLSHGDERNIDHLEADYFWLAGD